GRVVRVHPSKMAGAPDQAGLNVNLDAVWGPPGITGGDIAQNIAHRASLVVYDGIVDVDAQQNRGLLTDQAIPERGVGCIAIGSIFAEDTIGQGPFLLKSAEGEEELPDLLNQAAR